MDVYLTTQYENNYMVALKGVRLRADREQQKGWKQTVMIPAPAQGSNRLAAGTASFSRQRCLMSETKAVCTLAGSTKSKGYASPPNRRRESIELESSITVLKTSSL